MQKNIFKLLIVILLIVQAFVVLAQQTYVDSLQAVIQNALLNSKPQKSDIKAAIILVDYYSKVSFDTAKYYGFVAYKLSKTIKNDTGIAVSLNSIGMLYQICGYFDSAFPYLDSSRAIYVSLGDNKGLAFVRNNMAVAMMRKGNYAEALKYYHENLVYADSLNDLENLILSYNNIGITYFDWKK